jgi:hypothetical protein
MSLTQRENRIVRALVHIGLTASEVMSLLNERFKLDIRLGMVNGNSRRQGIKWSEYPTGDRGKYQENKDAVFKLAANTKSLELLQDKIGKAFPHLLEMPGADRKSSLVQKKRPKAKKSKPFPPQAVPKKEPAKKAVLVHSVSNKKPAKQTCAAKEESARSRYCWEPVVPGYPYCEKHLKKYPELTYSD